MHHSISTTWKKTNYHKATAEKWMSFASMVRHHGNQPAGARIELSFATEVEVRWLLDKLAFDLIIRFVIIFLIVSSYYLNVTKRIHIRTEHTNGYIKELCLIWLDSVTGFQSKFQSLLSPTVCYFLIVTISSSSSSCDLWYFQWIAYFIVQIGHIRRCKKHTTKDGLPNGIFTIVADGIHVN